MTDRIDRNGASTVTGVITLKYVQVQVQKMTVNVMSIPRVDFVQFRCITGSF